MSKAQLPAAREPIFTSRWCALTALACSLAACSSAATGNTGNPAGGTGSNAGSGNPASGAGQSASGSGGSSGNSPSGNAGSGVGSANPGGAGNAGGATTQGGAGGGSAGTSTGGSAGAVSTTPRDYPYCDYGAPPSGTAPAAWVDSPTLTPTGENPYGKPTTTIPIGYLLLSQGPTQPAGLTMATETAALTRINSDLKFVTGYSYIHLPPWTQPPKSHYIDYLLVGTGLPQDPMTGGDSSYEGAYPDVETNAVAMTDTSQRFDLTHEFFHVVENSYGTLLGQNVSWLQESYNDFLIMRLAENVGGGTAGQSAQFDLPGNIGYLDATVFEQPFTPIESCGINSSGAPTGPQDYFNDSTGFRYNELFPLFVDQRVSQHFFAAVWEQATTKEQVLQAMTRLLDKARVQCMVQEYSARLAVVDFAEFSSHIKGFADSKMYTATTLTSGSLVPSDATKLPRYTGRNNIPITVAQGGTSVSVDFTPDAAGSNGTPADMRLQLVYRATDGTVVFGAPVATGMATIAISKAPVKGVVIAVVTNVTLDGYKKPASYGWDVTETFGYKLQVTGGSAAPTNTTYF
jgi:hypothetical protein